MNTVKSISAFLVAITMMFMLGCASTEKREGTGEYIDDTVITAKVKAAILDEPGLKSAEINVETFKGIVQLSGFVSSQASINRAAEIARKIAAERQASLSAPRPHEVVTGSLTRRQRWRATLI